MTGCYLGIDLGISGVRAAVVTESGCPVGRGLHDLSLRDHARRERHLSGSGRPASNHCRLPVILAGVAFAKDRQQLMTDVATAIDHGAAGAAFGRNAWGASDPAAVVRGLCEIIHPGKGQAR
jgi:hypothetical protein